jgi:predicted nuclease of restriction endonuclease-like (RecB) superfamily
VSKEKKTKSTLEKVVTADKFLNREYAKTLADLKHQIQEAQLKAVISVNRELIRLYWKIGQTVAEKEVQEGWGAKVIEKLSKDLVSAFPDMKGFSTRNLLYMRQFFDAYPDLEITKQAVAQIPWGHNILLIQKLRTVEERLWYASKTIENGWSRSMLLIWIENNLYKREGKAITNFKDTLPLPQSDLAQQMTRDPYCFQFLSLEEDFREKELEKGLIDHVQKLLSEFGRGFAFVGRQCSLEVDGKEFLLDLLFYHTTLHCYVIAELKTEEFQPEFAGKMNFYLGAVDRLMKKDNDNPSIGLILCKSKSKIQVEIALQDIKKPIGVSDYLVEIEKSIPKELASSLPTIEEIEAELSDDSSFCKDR